MKFDELPISERLEYVEKASRLLDQGYVPPFFGEWHRGCDPATLLAEKIYEAETTRAQRTTRPSQ